jgi:hypothetical protein
MKIKSAYYVKNETYDDTPSQNVSIIVTTDTGVFGVPINTENRHYQEILEWVAEGNTITDNGGGE